jgi:eukaryotic-like serine/threonine-protein kinase
MSIAHDLTSRTTLRKLGKYEVLGELGHGAMGVVYRARDPIINRLVALKTITTGLADDPNLLQRFYREAQSAGGLQHPNIVTIYDMGEEQKLPYIAMELIEGESLDQVIQRRTTLSVTLKIAYALQACRAFDYAHKRGIVHRDIKPGNVMVTRDGVVKVVDFGIARVLDTSKTQTGMLIGTFAYMSPEQYNGEHADERSDIWSFGVLLYELLCYHRPFVGETPARLMHSICSQEPQRVCERATDCPPEIDAIVAKLLRKSAQERFQSMEDLLLELEPVHKALQAKAVAELIGLSLELLGKNEYSQARELLRESLKIDSANAQARALLERANAELKRLLTRPKAQLHVSKGRALLEEGRIQEAVTEAESALNLDSNFGPAQELEKDVRRELERAQMVAEWLQASGQRLAEGNPDEAEKSLARVFELDPQNKQAQELKQQAVVEKAERQRRLRLTEGMREARELWTKLKYDGCIDILDNLRAEFTEEEEIQRLLDTVREDQAEQYRQTSLGNARNLLAAGNYPDSRSLLVKLLQEFPSDEEILRLLEDVHAEEAKRRRQQVLAEARSLLSNRQYQESIGKLVVLYEEFPADREILLALETAREDQAEQEKQQGIAEARKLLAARRYDDCKAALATLQGRFPNDEAIPELQEAVRAEQLEQRKQAGLAKARNLLSAGQYEQSIEVLIQLGKDFAADEEIPKLLQTAHTEHREKEKQQGVGAVRNLLAAQRYEECSELLERLQKQFANDPEMSELQKALKTDQAEQRKSRSLGKARNLLSARNYEQALAVLNELAAEFPKDEAVLKLLAVAREGLTEQRKLKSLDEARTLLGARRYDESISLLTRLKKEFPDEREVSRLLANAAKEQAEQYKQEKLAEGRTLLAAQKFKEAQELLERLQEAHPKDSAIQKLRSAVERERDKQNRAERLQSELGILKKLISDKKYTEILVRAEPLRAEFPANADLLRLVEFARTQQAQIDNERRLRTVVDEVKAHNLANRFAEAIRAANAGLKTFPDNAELTYLREQAEGQEKKQKTRGMIEQRIREIKFKINREDLSEAIDLAKQTIAAVGPDADLTQLLNSAIVEFEARDRKRRQEQKLQEIRNLIESGDTLAAAQTLHDAVETLTLDSFDPRVTRVTQEIAGAPTPAGGPATIAAPPAPAGFSKEYALLQGRPLDFDTPTMEQGELDQTMTQQSPETSWTVSPETLVPGPPAPSEAATPIVGNTEAVIPQPEPISAPADPTPVPPAVAPPAISTAKVEQARREVASEPAEVPIPKPSRSFPESLRRAPGGRGRSSKATAEVVSQRRPFAKAPVLVGAGIALGLGLWATLHFVSSSRPRAPEIRVAHSDQTDPKTSGSGVPGSATVAKAPANPADNQQQDAIASADKLIASGDLPRALKVLQDAEKSNGSLTDEIKGKETAVSESMRNDTLAKLRQEEATLWQQSLREIDKREFDLAKRDLRQIVVLGDGAVRKADAQRYLSDVIPKRQKEEDTFRSAQRSSRAGDSQDLQRAADLLGQVIELDGPRKAESEVLRQDVANRMAALKQENAKRQIQSLETSARTNLQQGNFDIARQQAEQTRQLGGDPGGLLQEIDRAQTNEVQLQRQYQQVVQAYSSIGNRDKSALEKSRGDFQAIANGNGPHRVDAQQYVADINKKLEALSQPAVAPPPAIKSPTNTTAADEVAVRNVIDQFFQAFEQRNPDALARLWPSIPPTTYAGYKRDFERASAIQVKILRLTAKVNQDGSTASASAQVTQQYATNGEKSPKKTTSFVFQLVKNGVWSINAVQ